jgi:hypothetical protein
MYNPSQGSDVVASVNGGPLHAVSSQHAIVGQHISYVSQFYGVGKTLFIGFDPPAVTSVGLPASIVARTDDNGATWTIAALTNGAAHVNFLAGTPDGQGILGKNMQSGRIVVSSDGGVSWHTMPAAPRNLDYISGFISAVPDGTVFAEFSNGTGLTAQVVLYRASSRDAAWTLIYDFTATQRVIASQAVVWDAQGHPRMILASNFFLPADYYSLAL